jgi:hypothetical protein
MCGKFTAHATWQQVVDFSQPLTGEGGGEGGGDGEVYTYRVNGMLPITSGMLRSQATDRADEVGLFLIGGTGAGRSPSMRGPRPSTSCARLGKHSPTASAVSSSSRPSTKAKKSPSRPGQRQCSNGRSIQGTGSPAASRSSSAVSKFRTCRCRCSHAQWSRCRPMSLSGAQSRRRKRIHARRPSL